MDDSLEEPQLSKNAQKKLAKQEARRLAKEKAKLAKQTPDESPPEVSAASALKEEAEMNPQEYRKNRISMLRQYAGETGFPLYPNRFPITCHIAEYVAQYSDQISNGEHIEPPEGTISIAGRIESIRHASKKLVFFHLLEGGSRVQVLANLQHYGDKKHFTHITNLIRRGDVVGVFGMKARSIPGELSVIPIEIKLLSPCLHMLAPLGNELKDQEVRFRQRYLDLLLNKGSVHTAVTRSVLITGLRSFLNDRRFLEVETPMLNILAGGATAKPFKTHHNDLNLEMFMRIAPELYLKELVIGGLERVYEIGKNFRNEGVDLTHNPEFTAVEFYMAYANYEDLMTLTEELIMTLVFLANDLRIGNRTLKVERTSQNDEGEEVTTVIDFTPPYRRVDIIETLEEKLATKFPEDLESEETREFLVQQCISQEIEQPNPPTIAKLLDKLIGHLIEPECQQPTFLINHPRVMSPLAKSHEDNPQLTERFELFVAGWELCNAYTELNDPFVQAERFGDQAKQKDAGDDEAQPVDHGFVKALEHALPPTAGWGMGIDRLVMLLTNQHKIQEVILFPTMKPIVHDD